MLGDANKLFVFKSLFTKPSNVLPLHLKQTFHNSNFHWSWRWWDLIQATFKIFSTLNIYRQVFRMYQLLQLLHKSQLKLFSYDFLSKNCRPIFISEHFLIIKRWFRKWQFLLTLGRWFKKAPKCPYVIVKWSLSNTHIKV